MPYMKITYHAVTDHVWVKLDPADVEEATSDDDRDSLFDAVNPDQTVEAEYGPVVDTLPADVLKADWDLTR